MEHHDRDCVAACRLLAFSGYFQVKDGKAWITRTPTEADHAPVHIVHDALEAGSLRVGDKRSEGPAETFRQRHHEAKTRMQTDATYRAECEFWKRVYIRIMRGEDPVQAFLDEPQPTR